MTTTQASTSISVRGEAQRMTAPDEARVNIDLRVIAESTTAAVAELQVAVAAVLSDLTELGGVVFTADTRRAALTWSTESIRTHAEYGHNERTGEHGPTGRHEATVSLLVAVRDFTLLTAVPRVLTSRDAVEVVSVSWTVDDDNDAWPLVRADAIEAALRKGRDYATALGGTVTSIDHVADAGLLGNDVVMAHGQARNAPYNMSASAKWGGADDDLSLDPVPQVLNATIEARFTAAITAAHGRTHPGRSTPGADPRRRSAVVPSR